MKNSEIASIFYKMADYLEIKEEQFKPQAYRKAAMTIEELDEDIAELAKQGKLQELPGIGESLAKKIVEYIETGKIQAFERLRKELPIDIEALEKIEGIGPKKIAFLYKKFRVRNPEDLQRIIKRGKLKGVKGFGEKSEQRFLQGIQFSQKSKGRVLLGVALPEAEAIQEVLRKQREVKKVEIAGSLGRKKETIGDIDILIQSSDVEKTFDFISQLESVRRVLVKGETKISVILKSGIQVDVRNVPAASWGSGLQYFYGSKEHSIHLRQIAIKKGYKLSEYGLFKGKKMIAGKDEKGIYKRLGVAWMPPELREDRGEIEAGQKRSLPDLVSLQDVHGDFQMHTTYSDGADSVKQMAEACNRLGYHFMAISDHMGLKIAKAMDKKALLKQHEEIRQAQKRSSINIFRAAEVDINDKGKLNIDKSLLEHLDIVVGSVHMGLQQPKEKITQRYLSAIESGNMHILAHPTGRLLLERKGADADWSEVFKAAKKNHVALEINGHPKRLDLNDTMIQEARKYGCVFSTNSDSHSALQLPNMRYAVFTARRGWLEKEDSVNCWSLKKVERWIKRKE